MSDRISDEELLFLVSLKDQGLGWVDIAEQFNKKFKTDRHSESLRKAFSRNSHRLELGGVEHNAELLQRLSRTKKASALNSKDLKAVLDALDQKESVLESISNAVKDLNKLSYEKIKLPKPSKHKKGMTLELLISDVHFGKLTPTFNLKILQRRLKQISDTVAKEIQRASEHYNVEKLVISLIGDMIESATMHGVESARGCEFGNSRQVQECLSNTFHILLAPLFSLGIETDVIGITGNHDRTEFERTYVNPGQENVTWIIYKTMEEFTKMSKFDKVKWHIPSNAYHLHTIYGEHVLYEHYDLAGGGNRKKALENQLSKRVNQLNVPIKFMRGGHFHEPEEYGLGKIQINGNIPGDDGFSDSHGFKCEPTQTLNFYIEREKTDSIKRQTSFYKRFLIQLD